MIEDLILPQALGISVTTEADDNKSLLFGHDGLVDVLCGNEMGENHGTRFNTVMFSWLREDFDNEMLCDLVNRDSKAMFRFREYSEYLIPLHNLIYRSRSRVKMHFLPRFFHPLPYLTFFLSVNSTYCDMNAK